MKKGLAFSKSEKREGWKTESEEEKNERERFRRGIFLFFHFLSKVLSRESYNGKSEIFLFVKPGERIPRE